MGIAETPMGISEAPMSISEGKWGSPGRQWEWPKRQCLEGRRKCVLPGLQRAFPGANGNRRGGNEESRASDPQSAAATGIGDTAMGIGGAPIGISEASMALVEPPMRLNTLDRIRSEGLESARRASRPITSAGRRAGSAAQLPHLPALLRHLARVRPAVHNPGSARGRRDGRGLPGARSAADRRIVTDSDAPEAARRRQCYVCRMPNVPLKSLHPAGALSQPKLATLGRLSTEDLVRSLYPGEPGALKVKPEGLSWMGIIASTCSGSAV
jgi:hypothetical protein